MKNISPFFLVSLVLITVPAVSRAQLPVIGESNVRPIPEIKRLYGAFAGYWDTSEKRERSSFFQMEASARVERTRGWRPAAPRLVMEGHADGSAGPLSYIIVVWWDKDAKLYGCFTCFKDPDVGCEVRGTRTAFEKRASATMPLGL
jgi:hypothetical protein